ncbi:carbohydrate kinase family protein [Deinococcus ruber]|uniref:Fructokinase n=1 Tax=Deinococcus ruber TaxID=1848197 RepID=A0A918C0Q8_9DEIO|nr:carbohydrate kinase [Deinococcus ruber]GGQ99358.1 fructokinase [Deinococcus ruber]
MTHDLPQSLPLIVSAGEALTDLVTTGANTWAAHPGGAGWNVARAVAALGTSSAFAGAVGQDNFGDDLWAASQAAGLDLRFMQRAPQPTLLAVVYSANPPAYRFLGENSADLHFDAARLPEGWQGAARWLHLGGISLARQPLAGNLLDLMRSAQAAGVKISFDPNARIVHSDPSYRPVFETVLRNSDLIKLSDEDLRFFFPGQDEDSALRTLRGLNSQSPIVITRGGDGATLYHAAGSASLPAPKVQVADTVGAGDALCAGLLVSATEQPSALWTQHLAFALRVASAACSRPGAYSPTRQDVQALFP